MGKLRDRINEWAANGNEGVSFGDDGVPFIDFEDASYKPPVYRNRRAMTVYLESRNRARMKRIRSDFAWMKKQLEEAGLNPEDARFLL